MRSIRISGASFWRATAIFALAAGNFVLAALLWGARGRSQQLHSGDLAAMFLNLGQYVLLAAWCAWGDGRAVWRWLAAVAALAAITATDNYFAAQSLGRYSDAFFDIAAIGGVSMAGCYACFLPLRWVLGWRLTFGGAVAGGQRGQFRLKHWLVWTAALGAPLAVIRLVYPAERTLECLIWCVLSVLVSLPWIVVFFRAAFSRRPWLWSAAAVAFSIVAGIAEESLVTYGTMDGAVTLPWELRLLLVLQFCGMNLGLAAGLLGNLLVLRLAGLQFSAALEPSAAALRRSAETLNSAAPDRVKLCAAPNMTG